MGRHMDRHTDRCEKQYTLSPTNNICECVCVCGGGGGLGGGRGHRMILKCTKVFDSMFGKKCMPGLITAGHIRNEINCLQSV